MSGSGAPRMGLASIALPLVFAAIWLYFEKGGGESLGYAAPLVLALLLVASGVAALGGAILGAMGWTRGERPRFVPALGFVLNAGIVLLFIVFR